MRLTKERTKRVDVPNDPDGGFVVLRALSKEAVAQIESEYMVVTQDGVELRKFAERQATLARERIKDWGNLEDEYGNPLKCTVKNLELAARFNIDVDGEQKRFFQWVNDEGEKFEDEVDAKETEASKN